MARENMPHLILDCSRTIDKHASLDTLIQVVHDTAESTGLFNEGEVKVRLNLFDHYTVGGTRDDFVHIIAYIWTGRSEEQRSDLSRRIVRALKSLLPNVKIISVDIREINRATYNNLDTV
jgi:5-carboxymethyl-2-hydroxymuconate isomerase